MTAAGTAHIGALDARLVAAGFARTAAQRGLAVMAYGTPAAMTLCIGIEDELTIDDSATAPDPFSSLATFVNRAAGHFLFGYVGYDVHRRTVPALQRSPHPALTFIVPHIVLRIDGTGTTVLQGRDAAPTLRWLRQSVVATPMAATHSLASFDQDGARGDFERLVTVVLDWIGEERERRLTIARRVDLPEVDLAASAACDSVVSPVVRSFYLHIGGIEMAGSSPELLAEGTPAWFRTCKLAATYPRSQDCGRDRVLRNAFVCDAKMKEEHRLSADALQRALAAGGQTRRCGPSVLDLPRIRHLLTTFETTLPRTANAADALRLVFPSGANPYAEGVARLAAIESRARGPYYGLIGLIRPDGEFAFSQILRTIFRDASGCYTMVGAAVTRDSRPAAEALETYLKLSSIVAAAHGDWAKLACTPGHERRPGAPRGSAGGVISSAHGRRAG